MNAEHAFIVLIATNAMAIFAQNSTPLFFTIGKARIRSSSPSGGHDPLIGVFEWTHKHFPKFLDCRPIYVRESLENAGLKIEKAVKKHRWIPVEIILGVKP